MAEWKPTTFLRLEEALDTSMGTARIVTDAGPGYIKALGNRQGPHPLACELVGTYLARWFGLPTLDFALMQIDAEIDEIPFLRGGNAASGTAYVTRTVLGHTWGGSLDELRHLVNPEAISWLVVFDTWTLNCDRHPPDLALRKPNYDNVLLEDAGEQPTKNWRLLAIDHTHCFTCGRDLGPDTARIDRVKDDRLYGLFPAFASEIRGEHLAAALRRLEQLKEETVVEAVQSIPADWQVDLAARAALTELICRRAVFVVESMWRAVARQCWQGRFYDCD